MSLPRFVEVDGRRYLGAIWSSCTRRRLNRKTHSLYCLSFAKIIDLPPSDTESRAC
jgi:hypothetical protein